MNLPPSTGAAPGPTLSQRLTHFFASRRGIITAGAAIGVLAPLLQYAGNPANMGICVACFERDIAGALGFHRAAVVQYIRLEIPGFVLGPLLAAFAFCEFRPRTGSSPVIRFVLGVFAMIGALARRRRHGLVPSPWMGVECQSPWRTCFLGLPWKRDGRYSQSQPQSGAQHGAPGALPHGRNASRLAPPRGLALTARLLPWQ